MRVVGYVRVSTRQQTLGDSLAAQEQAIRDWAGGRGHEVVDVVGDAGASGTLDSADRPGLLAAVSACEAGDAEALVVPHLDRLARALHVQEAVLASIWVSGASVWEVAGDVEVKQNDPSDPYRTFVRQIMGAASELERGLVRARLQGGRKRKEQRGGYAGGFVPYGWRVEGRGKAALLVEVEVEQKTLSRMKRLRRTNTLREVASKLNAKGITAKGGGKWSHASVRCALRRLS